MNKFNNFVENNLRFLENDYVSSALTIFLVVYAGMAAPNLPESIARLFDNTVFRMLIFFLVAYSSQKNPTVAAVAAVGLMVSLQTLNRYDVGKILMSNTRSLIGSNEPSPVVDVTSSVSAVEAAPENGEITGVDESEGSGYPIEESSSNSEMVAECQGNCNVEQAAAPDNNDGVAGYDNVSNNFAEL